MPTLDELAALCDDGGGADDRRDGDTAFGPRLRVKLRTKMRQLRRMRGTGVTGYRNEYLKALSEMFVDRRAASVVSLLEDFAERFLNAELPAWFYYACNHRSSTTRTRPSRSARRARSSRAVCPTCDRSARASASRA